MVGAVIPVDGGGDAASRADDWPTPAPEPRRGGGTSGRIRWLSPNSCQRYRSATAASYEGSSSGRPAIVFEHRQV